jgi:hypothetical protein
VYGFFASSAFGIVAVTEAFGLEVSGLLPQPFPILAWSVTPQDDWPVRSLKNGDVSDEQELLGNTS